MTQVKEVAPGRAAPYRLAMPETSPEIRAERADDEAAIRRLLTLAFAGPAEAGLVERLRADGALVLALVAVDDGEIVGHVAFSRLHVERNGASEPALALAPLAVHPDRQRQGVGSALVEAAHGRLRASGERLSVVLGDLRCYRRFDYRRERAAGFDSPYPAEHLGAAAWGDAPERGRLLYPAAFAAL